MFTNSPTNWASLSNDRAVLERERVVIWLIANKPVTASQFQIDNHSAQHSKEQSRLLSKTITRSAIEINDTKRKRFKCKQIVLAVVKDNNFLLLLLFISKENPIIFHGGNKLKSGRRRRQADKDEMGPGARCNSTECGPNDYGTGCVPSSRYANDTINSQSVSQQDDGCPRLLK